MKLVSIGYLADLYGVCNQTIRNWCAEGMFRVYRTAGGHRRFSLEEIGALEEEKTTIIYSRVSSAEQKEDLKRQTEELKNYCKDEGIEQYEVIEDIGSGINYNKRGLQKLLRKIIVGETKRIVIGFKDRLLRFGSELLLQICALLGIEVIILHEEQQTSFEKRLVEDVLTIMIVYSSKIYGRRSHVKRRCRLANE